MKILHIILNWKYVGKTIFGCGTKRDTNVILSLIDKRDCHLGKGCYQLPVSHGVGVFLSHRPNHCFKIVELLLVPVSLKDAWLPHCQRGRACVAERTQVQVPGITGAECR